jgi:hypothetical protein
LEDKATGLLFYEIRTEKRPGYCAASPDVTIPSMVTDSSDDPKMEERRKPYEKPTATQLTKEEAKRKLIEHARRGDQGAKEMLEMMFPEEAQRLCIDKKKSA